MSKATAKIQVYYTKAYGGNIPNLWMYGMSSEKRSRIEKQKNAAERSLMITAHRLLCWALKTHCSMMPGEDDWATGWHGKPYLKKAPHVHFNISHSGSIALCALHNEPVGIDIEAIKPVDEGVELRFMSGRELDYYHKAPDKKSLFYKIWTLKEAYLKYCGRGLGTHLKKVTIYPEGDSIITNLTGCDFSLLNLKMPAYQAALCARETDHFIEPVETGSLVNF